jgi:hypothetical protein
MALALLSLLNYACQDDNIGGNERGEVIPGQPATVNLTVNVGDMGIRTRASIANDDAKSSYCQNLWIGIYDASTGNLQDKYYFDVSSTEEEQGLDHQYPLSLKTKSVEKAYIVAVANSDVNNGVADVNDYDPKDNTTLRSLLDEADTYEKYQKICALRPDAYDVNVYAKTLTMSGWYADSKPKMGESIQAVAIPTGSSNFTGAIYLSRIISYNKFYVKAGENISLTLNSWQLFNIPAGCYLMEHAGTDNVGDNYTGQQSFFNKSNIDRSFTATDITDDEGNTTKGHCFEFYQLENKHYATSSISDYNQRMNAAPDNASYLVLNATIDYYYDPKDDPKTAKPVPSTTEGAIHRAAKVDYTIYLGYCEEEKDDGTTINKAQDFNCRRNTKYTYTATVKGVNNIVVDAQKSTDPEPGTEGWVSDDVGGFEELDSHYCEFNIYLSDYDRSTMRYRVTSPYGDDSYTYERKTDGTHEPKKNGAIVNAINEELYSWVKFYPTSDENTLAVYNGGKGKNSKGEGTKLWTLDDLCDPDNYPSPYDADPVEDGEDANTGGKWYTVFVDEYVYHFEDHETGSDATDPSIKYYDEVSWPNYVNKDDRLVELIMTIDMSSDEKSIYSHCKYAFAQKSIQTYYKGGADCTTAVGVEHEEETYCLNMNWNFISSGWSGERTEQNYNYRNGRYNLYNYLNIKVGNSWDNVALQTAPGHVTGDENTKYGTSHPDADYPVFMPKPFSTTASGRLGNSPCPNKDSNVYYANSICMNRNRDLNGNGVIEPNEIRWFTPTSSVYQQIAIAQTELPDPIMKLSEYSKYYFDWSSDDRYGTYNFHYITSDYLYYWAEQVLNVGNNPFSGYGPDVSAAYTARCVRNLGSDPSNIPTLAGREVEDAFVYDSNANTFTQSYFTDETLRGYNFGALTPSTMAEPESRLYKKFECAADFCKNIKGEKLSVNGDGILQWGSVSTADNTAALYAMTAAWSQSVYDNDICGKYTQESDESDLGEWRVPSASEMSLMWIENIMLNDNAYALSATCDYFVSYYLKDYTDYDQLFVGYNNCKSPLREVMAFDCLRGNERGPGSIKVRCVRDVKM